jgi:hypothetical protein
MSQDKEVDGADASQRSGHEVTAQRCNSAMKPQPLIEPAELPLDMRQAGSVGAGEPWLIEGPFGSG